MAVRRNLDPLIAAELIRRGWATDDETEAFARTRRTAEGSHHYPNRVAAGGETASLPELKSRLQKGLTVNYNNINNKFINSPIGNLVQGEQTLHQDADFSSQHTSHLQGPRELRNATGRGEGDPLTRKDVLKTLLDIAGKLAVGLTLAVQPSIWHCIRGAVARLL